MDSEFCIEVGDVVADGLLREPQIQSDVAVVPTTSDVLQDLFFAFGQRRHLACRHLVY